MSKSGTSAATRTGCWDASNVRIGPTPLRPLTHAFQNASLPKPLGATTPSPVTTTLRMAIAPPEHAGRPAAPALPEPEGDPFWDGRSLRNAVRGCPAGGPFRQAGCAIHPWLPDHLDSLLTQD